jgi:hypothetical protein
MVKNERRVLSAKKAAEKNPWIAHVKKCAKERTLSYKQGLKVCKQTYSSTASSKKSGKGEAKLNGAAPIKSKIEKAVLFGDSSNSSKMRMPTNMKVELATKALKVRGKILKKRFDERKNQLLDRMNKLTSK